MKLHFIILLAIGGLLSACSSTVPLQIQQAQQLQLQSSGPALEATLGKSTPTKQAEVQVDAQTYLYREYQLFVRHQSTLMTVCTPNCMLVPTTVPVYEPFVVVQKLPERTLFARGTVADLNKSNDTTVKRIMASAKSAPKK